MTRALVIYENLTPAGRVLYDILVKVWNNEHFIGAILSYISEEEDRIKFIEFLRKHPELNDEDITVYALKKDLGMDNPIDNEHFKDS